jgi:hypothetical protein
MKLSAITLAAAATVALAAVGAGQAFATASHTTPKTLRVVMRDPGCHWFAIGGKFTTSATLPDRMRLLNLDMAALTVASSGAVKRIPVGSSIMLGRGHYAITMVGQARDDNHLKLTVR